MITVVTGGAGFLGSRVVRRLVERGERVRAVDLARATWSRLDGLAAEQCTADITDRDSVARALDGASRVIHVAALYELGTRDPHRMQRINVGGTENVLDAALAISASVVHVSTVAALGPTGVASVDETHWNPERPRSHYASTKREAHLLARDRMRKGSVRIAMPATIWGDGDPSMLGRAEHLLARARIKPRLRDDMRLCFVHVDDCAEGVVRVAERGRDGEEYVLCSEVIPLAAWIDRAATHALVTLPIPDRLLDAAHAVTSRVPEHLRLGIAPLRLLHEAAEMSAHAHWSFRGDKARSELGWTPVSAVIR